MELNHLKKGFGYTKASVFEYVTSINEDFSHKLSEKEAKNNEMEKQYQARINQLEEELLDLKQKLDAKEEDKEALSATMLEAVYYAELIKKEAESEVQKEQKLWESELAKKNQELDLYQDKIKSLHVMLQDFLRTLNEQTIDFKERIQLVKNESPKRNMGLFERKNDAME